MKMISKNEIDINKTDKILEIVSWAFLMIIWLTSIISYKTLPDKIPTHFNIDGIADKFGDKFEIFTLPIIGTILTIGLTILNKYLNSSNILGKRNNLGNNAITMRIVRFLKIAILVIFGMIMIHTIEIAKNHSNGLGNWLLILTIIVINIPPIYYLTKLKLTKKT
ncbi:DUF1648 domain-containing protein [Christiangramia aquimixticola]|uniref:DUF1648 domain-containing protein n=1 Tax=Christiangramia aquimixticola TaxID=1697558 RepID=UPI003AA962BC